MTMYLDIGIEGFPSRKKDGDTQVAVRGSPVDWQTFIVVFSVNQLGICLRIYEDITLNFNRDRGILTFNKDSTTSATQKLISAWSLKE